MLHKVLLFYQMNQNVITAGGSILLVLITVFIRTPLAKGVLRLTGTCLFRHDEKRRLSLTQSLLNPLRAFLLLLGVFMALYMNIQEGALLRVFKIISILILCWALFNYLSDNLLFILRAEEHKSHLNQTAIRFISNLLKTVVVLLAIVMIISELGYNINGLITGLGVGGLAISLAAQDAVANLISGFIIVLDKPFVVGDFIESKSISGTVMEVTMRTTKIRTLEDSIVTVPNKELVNDAIINNSERSRRLINLNFGLSYQTTNALLEKCCHDIKSMLHADEMIFDATMRVELEALDDSQLTINVFCYTKITEIGAYKAKISEINMNIKNIIEQNGAAFAFPSRSVYLNNNHA